MIFDVAVTAMMNARQAIVALTTSQPVSSLTHLGHGFLHGGSHAPGVRTFTLWNRSLRAWYRTRCRPGGCRTTRAPRLPPRSEPRPSRRPGPKATALVRGARARPATPARLHARAVAGRRWSI